MQSDTAQKADPKARHSISSLGQRYRDGSHGPVAEAESALARLAAWNPTINAVCDVRPERTLEAAKASEARLRQGKALGPLDGVTFTIKDTFSATGYPFRRGSLTTSDALATENSPAVERLLKAGAVPLGITTTPEFGAGLVTISPLTGVTRNAWDPSKTSGGSSGGAAASIAAGIGSFALATDSGGSIRIPSALNGVVGLKPTGGRVPYRPANLAGNLACPGPIARSVEDIAYVMAALGNSDAQDPDALLDPLPDYLSALALGINGVRIGYSPSLGYAKWVDPEVEAHCSAALAHFANAGAVVGESSASLNDPIEAYKTLFMCGYAYGLRNMSAASMELLGPDIKQVLEFGRGKSLTDYLDAQATRRALTTAVAAIFEDIDLLVTPTVSVTAFDAERIQPKEFEAYNETRAWSPFGYPFNLTHQPAATVPCGVSRSGLPIGLHIVGKRGAETLVLRAARTIERAGLFTLDYFRDPPSA